MTCGNSSHPIEFEFISSRRRIPLDSENTRTPYPDVPGRDSSTAPGQAPWSKRRSGQGTYQMAMTRGREGRLPTGEEPRDVFGWVIDDAGIISYGGVGLVTDCGLPA